MLNERQKISELLWPLPQKVSCVCHLAIQNPPVKILIYVDEQKAGRRGHTCFIVIIARFFFFFKKKDVM